MRFRRTVRVLHGQWDALPFLCVLFPLAFFLLFNQYLVLPRGVLVELPVGGDGVRLDPALPRIVVAVDALGRLYIENQFVVESELGRRLVEHRAHAPAEPVVVVQGDGRVTLGAYVRVGEIARQAGIKQVFFVTRPAP